MLGLIILRTANYKSWWFYIKTLIYLSLLEKIHVHNVILILLLLHNLVKVKFNVGIHFDIYCLKKIMSYN